MHEKLRRKDFSLDLYCRDQIHGFRKRERGSSYSSFSLCSSQISQWMVSLQASTPGEIDQHVDFVWISVEIGSCAAVKHYEELSIINFGYDDLLSSLRYKILYSINI